MKKTEKAALIFSILEAYFPHPTPPLQHSDTYTLLIAVLLSARSTDAMVNRVTPRLFAKAKTPQEMVKLTIEQIQDIVRPCGLSRNKATAIWQLSQIVLKRYKGKVPGSFEALEEFPGVGHKTASVVMAQGFNEPAFPVDTHIERCARRWGLSRSKTAAGVERDLKALFPRETWNKLHLQIIYFARKYCPARAHNLEKCPICSALANEKLPIF